MRYYEHPYLTLVHVVFGFLFMTLGPVQFWPAVRNRFLRYHRWAGRVWMIAALVGAMSAILFVPTLPVFGSFATSSPSCSLALCSCFAWRKATAVSANERLRGIANG